MKMHKRANQILEFLTEEKKMEVSQLAQKLGVSQVTVRKDLDELESQLMFGCLCFLRSKMFFLLFVQDFFFFFFFSFS